MTVISLSITKVLSSFTAVFQMSIVITKKHYFSGFFKNQPINIKHSTKQPPSHDYDLLNAQLHIRLGRYSSPNMAVIIRQNHC